MLWPPLKQHEHIVGYINKSMTLRTWEKCPLFLVFVSELCGLLYPTLWQGQRQLMPERKKRWRTSGEEWGSQRWHNVWTWNPGGNCKTSPGLKGCVWVMSCESLEFVWSQKEGICLNTEAFALLRSLQKGCGLVTRKPLCPQKVSGWTE